MMAQYRPSPTALHRPYRPSPTALYRPYRPSPTALYRPSPTAVHRPYRPSPTACLLHRYRRAGIPNDRLGGELFDGAWHTPEQMSVHLSVRMPMHMSIRRYSAGKMRLAVVGAEPLDTLEEWVHTHTHTHAHVYAQVYARMRMYGRTDGRTDGRMDGRMLGAIAFRAGCRGCGGGDGSERRTAAAAARERVDPALPHHPAPAGRPYLYRP